jgi:hypothetical protein
LQVQGTKIFTGV